MIVVSHNLPIDLSWAHLFVLFLIVSNLSLNLVPEQTLTKPAFYFAVAVTDIALVTAALIISGQTGSDFYLMYFLVIIISALSRQLNRIIISTVLVTLIYGLTLLVTTYERTIADPTILLRFPFFYIISLFYGHVVHTINQARLRKEELAREEVNRLKARFLDNVTYQLLRPVNAILADLHLAVTGAAGDLALEQLKLVDRLQLNAERLLGPIHELVDLSKIEARKVVLQIRRVAVRTLLDEVQLDLRPSLDGKSLRVESLCDDHLPMIETDANKLRQALIYSLASAGKVTSSDRLVLTAYGETEGGSVTFSITDREVSKEEVTGFSGKVESGELKDPLNGNGLGVRITVAKNLVEMLGGIMRVKKTPGTNPEIAIAIPVSWGSRPKEFTEINYV